MKNEPINILIRNAKLEDADAIVKAERAIAEQPGYFCSYPPYFDGICHYWIGLINNDSYCLAVTTEVVGTETALSDLWRSHLSKKGRTFTIDFMIGNQTSSLIGSVYVTLTRYIRIHVRVFISLGFL